jgi:hypothetical protein
VTRSKIFLEEIEKNTAQKEQVEMVCPDRELFDGVHWGGQRRIYSRENLRLEVVLEELGFLLYTILNLEGATFWDLYRPHQVERMT